jgi:hypothetical protein
VFVPVAQLHCAIEVSALPAESRAGATTAAGVEHVFEYADALTGEALAAGDVSALAPTAVARDGRPLAVAGAETSTDGTALRRFYTLPATGEYTLRVDGADSLRYFGCSADFPVSGTVARRVRVALVPRARDVMVDVAVTRDGGRRGLPRSALALIDVRPSAAAEREAEVHRGTCSGERPAHGSFWCVRSLAERPAPVGLAALVPGYGVATMTLDPTRTERTVVVTAEYEGHHLPTVVARVGVWAALLNGDGAGGYGAVEVVGGSSGHGQTCPIGDTCVRPVAHFSIGASPYQREHVLVGPLGRVTSEGTLGATLAWVEAGAGVTVFPRGTGDRLRATALASGVLGLRPDEYATAPVEYQVSRASTCAGLSAEITAAWRVFNFVQVFAGARLLWFPSVGGRGRDFTYLGDARVSPETASLVQLGLHAGIGVEP